MFPLVCFQKLALELKQKDDNRSHFDLKKQFKDNIPSRYGFNNISENQQDFNQKFNKVFDEYDFLIIPTTAGFAPKFNQTEKDDTCLIWTTLGFPSINIPIYNSKKNDLPYGLQIISKKYCDFLLLDFLDTLSSQSECANNTLSLAKKRREEREYARVT